MRKLKDNQRHHGVVDALPLQQRAFTLIEILIVIALSVLLFGLLLKPLISSLQYTKEAQALAAAQDSSRKVLEMMNRELGSAAYVFDNRSHPFIVDSTAPASGNDLYTDFLNLEIPTATNGRTIAHCYNAKLDIVMARRKKGTNTLLDPTISGDSITVSPGGLGQSGVVTASEVQFPLAPGSTIIRYFIGLKNPAKSFSNLNEQRDNPAHDNNTYVLYRAQVNPSNLNGTTNTTLFAQVSATIDKPELDDPDFFRFVTDNDIDWLSPSHDTYGTTGNRVAHNDRVANWIQAAKPIVTAPDIDLLVLPRDSEGGIDYDTNAPFVGIPHFGVVADPTTGAPNNPYTGTKQWPIVRSSMIFRPATISSEAVPSTTTDYASLGVPANAADTGVHYIPSVYTATSKSWSIPYTIDLYPNGSFNPLADRHYYIQSTNTDGNAVALTANDTPGDIIEYIHDPVGAPTDYPVYNVTKGIPEVAYSGTPTPQSFVPLSVDADKGSISFDIGPHPATDVNSDNPPFWPPLIPNQTTPQPTPATWPPTAAVDYGNSFWYFGAADLEVTTPINGVGNHEIDTTKLVDKNNVLRSPLGLITNAILVPGSVRVYGPDNTAGPNFGVAVMYTAVLAGSDPVGNQYHVDYATGIIRFATSLPKTQIGLNTIADPVQLTFRYQANISGTAPFDTTNLAHPLRVTVDYQTRDLLEINVGIRVYRPGTSTAQIINATNNVAVGNSNR